MMEISKMNFTPVDYSLGFKSEIKEDINSNRVNIMKANGEFVNQDIIHKENIQFDLKNQPVSAFKAVTPKDKSKGLCDFCLFAMPTGRNFKVKRLLCLE